MVNVNKCIFCNNTELSNEHIWPRWVRRLASSDLSKKRSEREVKFQDGILSETKKEKGGSVLESVSRSVCKTCNSGWMSQIEDEVSKLYKDMKNKSIILKKDNMHLLSLWIAVKLCIIECITSVSIIQQCDRNDIYRNRIIAGNWQIWIGRNINFTETMSLIRYTAFVRTDGSIDIALPPNTQTLTLNLKEILFVVLMSNDKKLPVRINRYIDDKMMIKICPRELVQFEWCEKANVSIEQFANMGRSLQDACKLNWNPFSEKDDEPRIEL
jgi:hypothetical protein